MSSELELFDRDTSTQGSRDGAGSLEQALAEHQQRVEALLKSAGSYVKALRDWKKACQLGHMANRKKAADQATELAPGLAAPTAEAAAAWDFDVRAYLEGEAWRRELQAACAESGLRVLEEEETLISPPIIARSQPGPSRLLLGKVAWPTLHPTVTAAYLKRLNEKSAASTRVLQQFLNALYDGCKKICPGRPSARFRDLYDLYDLAPGWARENSPASFAQQIYALHRAREESRVRMTRDGKTFELEYATGDDKGKRSIFSIVSDDGRPIRYYGIWFR